MGHSLLCCDIIKYYYSILDYQNNDHFMVFGKISHHFNYKELYSNYNKTCLQLYEVVQIMYTISYDVYLYKLKQ